MMKRQQLRRKPRFPVQESLLVLVVLLAAFIFNYFAHRTLILADVLSPGWRLIASIQQQSNGFIREVKRFNTLQQDNDRLQKENTKLKADLLLSDEAIKQNARFIELLKLPLPPKAMPQEVGLVIARNPDNWRQKLFINKGVSEGIVKDSVILVSEGLVGKVIQVSDHLSLVALLNEPSLAISVINARTRANAIMQGQGDQSPALKFTERLEQWKTGDKLYTSGLGGIYPKGIYVGTLIKHTFIKKSPLQPLPPNQLEVKISAPLERLEEVLILPPGPGDMPQPLPQASPSPSPSVSPSPSSKPAR
jgi:rod shape-determining protein MreC